MDALQSGGRKISSPLLPSALHSQHSEALSEQTFQAVTCPNEETKNAYCPTHFHTEYGHLVSLLSQVPSRILLELIFFLTVHKVKRS